MRIEPNGFDRDRPGSNGLVILARELIVRPDLAHTALRADGPIDVGRLGA